MNRLPESWQAWLAGRMAEKEAAHNQRRLQPLARQGVYVQHQGRRLVNLAGNDYLGIGADTDWLAEFWAQTPPEERLPSASASQLLAGHAPAHRRLEHTLTELFQAPAAVGFTSGYQMNQGLLAALAGGPHTLVLADKLVHASMVDGILLSKAPFRRYRHNDMAHLADLLARHHRDYERIVIVTESIFSMDGDEADLAQLLRFKRQYANVALYVDEAHAVGVRGATGLGCAEAAGCIGEIDFLVGTFGKAVGSVGGYLICTDLVRRYVVNHVRPLIFSTALPPLNAAWTDFVLRRLPALHGRRRHLAAISRRLADAVREKYGVCPSTSHIVPLITGTNQSALDKAAELMRHGFYAAAVRPPTVPNHQARVRFSLSAALDEETVARLAEAL